MTMPPAAATEPAPHWSTAYAGAPPEYLDWLDRQFRFDVLLVRQKLLTISQKYVIEDRDGNPRFFVVRPPRLALNLLVGVLATIANLVVLFLAFRLIILQNELLAGLLVLVVGGQLVGLVAILLSPYRDITIYTDETEQHALMRVVQENKLGIFQHYTLYDAFGVHVADFRRNNLLSIVRRSWRVFVPGTTEEIVLVQEDHLIKAALRRWLGTLYGLLRTNFEFVLPDGTKAGEYNRMLTLTDQYVLDLRADAMHLLDRRVCLVMAILLDSGESR